MLKHFKRFSKKDSKILKRELGLAHGTIALLSLGMLALLAELQVQADTYVQSLIDAASVLLVFVMLISVTITVYIFKNR